MKPALARPFCLPLLLVFVTIVTFTAVGFSGQSRARGGAGGPAVTSRRLLAGEDTAQSPRRDKAWLLAPEVFDRLSAGGKRAVLRMHGFLRADRLPSPVNMQSAQAAAAFAPGDNLRVNDPSLDEFGHTQSETSIAVNGQNVIVSFNDAGFFDAAGYAFSTDGGSTFTHRRIPVPKDGDTGGDGVVAFGPNGEAYYVTLADNRQDQSIIGVAKSTDGGATFAPPVDASTTADNDSDFQDKPWLTVDRNPASPFKGNVYVAWTDFTDALGNFIYLARSTDGGETFRKPEMISPLDGKEMVQGAMPAVAPNGDLYIAYADLHFNAAGGITVVKSTDGGKTFSAPKSAAALLTIGTATGGDNVRTNSFPSVAVDKNGAVQIVFDAVATSPSGDRSDVFHVRSTDGGATYSAPRKLNDDGTQTTQFMPSVAAAGDGTLAVKWWDRRNDPLGDNLTDVYATISTDGGLSFGKNFRITNHNWLFGPSEFGDYHGDYDGMAADAGNFYLSWSDERGSDPDAYFTRIPTSRDAAAPDFNISARATLDNVTAGSSREMEFSTSPANGFVGNVTLSVSPAIAGVSFGFASATVSAGDTARLTVTTAVTAKAGAYLLTVTATGQGITRKTNYRLNIFDAQRAIGLPHNITSTRGFTDFRGGLRVAANGTLHLAFSDDSANVTGEDVYYAKSTDGGASFSPPVRVSPVGAIAFDGTLALDAAGNPYITWAEQRSNPAGFAVVVSRSTDGGASFSPPVAVSPGTQAAVVPNLAVDRAGNLLVTYLDVSQRLAPLFAARSTDGGASFAAPAQLSQSGESVGGLGGPVAFDSRGAAYVVYNNNSSVTLTAAPDGAHFNVVNVLSEAGSLSFAPHLAVDAGDAIYVTFYQVIIGGPAFINREVMVTRSTDRGVTFRPLVDASNTPAHSRYPYLILGKPGEVNVVWEESLSGQEDVLIARSTDSGVTFSAAANLSANFGLSTLPGGGADAAGNLLAVWTDDSTANPDLQALDLPGLPPPAADFALAFGSSPVIIQRGSTASLPVFISRPGGFSGNVTVTLPDVTPLKMKLKGEATQATTGDSVTFRLKVKAGGPTGAQQLLVTARDDAGRTRTATLNLYFQ